MASEKPFVAVTCTAPVNIAVIKYWGKRDEELILPINSSLSVTLHQDQLKTTTTAVISKDFTEDQIWLNGRKEDVGQPRIQACLRESEWESYMGHWGQIQPVPSHLSLPCWAGSESTAGAAASLLPTQLSDPPRDWGMPVGTVRFVSGV